MEPAQIADITDTDAAILQSTTDAVLSNTMVVLNSQAMTLNEFVKQTHATYGIAPTEVVAIPPSATPRRFDSPITPTWKLSTPTSTPSDVSLLPAQLALLNANISALTTAVEKLCGVLGAS